MNIKADEYFTFGPFSVARYGKFVEMKNHITPNAHKEMMQKLVEDYPIKKQEIDDCILELRGLIIKCNPILLLQFTQSNMLMSLYGKTSEFQYGFDDVNSARLTEYAQSVIVSSPNEYVGNDDDPTDLFLEIQSKFNNLRNLITQFYFYWGAYTLANNTSLNNENIDMLVQAQMLYDVRGDRYQIHEIEYLRSLILPHDAEIKKCFNISVQSIIDGIEKLQYALSQGKADAFNRFGDMFDLMEDMSDEEMEEYMSANIDCGRSLVQDMFGFSLNDVASITSWPNEFIEKLAYGINEDDEFFSNKEFSGWTIVDLPIQKKPFLKIADRYYCFDYFSLMDNFYRVLQKTLMKHDKSYNWAEVQSYASEEMVENIFKSILPGCTIYRNNYYPIKSSLKNMAENDILILYCDLLFIVEIKAGSFVYTPPITNFDAHIKSYKKLIEEPEEQCLRTLNYITANTEATIYDSQKNVKAIISVPNKDNVFTFSITVDNINSFAAKAEKLKFLNLSVKSHSWENGVRKYRSNDKLSRIEHTDDGIKITDTFGKTKIQDDESKKEIRYEFDVNSYSLSNVYRILLKMALSILPEGDFKKFAIAADSLVNRKLLGYEVLSLSFFPGFNRFEFTVMGYVKKLTILRFLHINLQL